jgi:hypothetical protein
VIPTTYSTCILLAIQIISFIYFAQKWIKKLWHDKNNSKLQTYLKLHIWWAEFNYYTWFYRDLIFVIFLYIICFRNLTIYYLVQVWPQKFRLNTLGTLHANVTSCNTTRPAISVRPGVCYVLLGSRKATNKILLFIKKILLVKLQSFFLSFQKLGENLIYSFKKIIISVTHNLVSVSTWISIKKPPNIFHHLMQ